VDGGPRRRRSTLVGGVAHPCERVHCALSRRDRRVTGVRASRGLGVSRLSAATITVEGHRNVFVNCTGDGSPTVVLEARLRQRRRSGSDFEALEEASARTPSVHLRPGQPGPKRLRTVDNTIEDSVADLHSLIWAIGRLALQWCSWGIPTAASSPDCSRLGTWGCRSNGPDRRHACRLSRRGARLIRPGRWSDFVGREAAAFEARWHPRPGCCCGRGGEHARPLLAVPLRVILATGGLEVPFAISRQGRA